MHPSPPAETERLHAHDAPRDTGDPRAW